MIAKALTFTVVIVTYNRIKLLKECLERVENQTSCVESIVIVNNNSQDGTTEYLATLVENRKYHIVNLHENMGGAGGFYYGVKEALSCSGEWILLIDDAVSYTHLTLPTMAVV